MAMAGMSTIKYRTTNDVGITGTDVDAEKVQLNIVNVYTMLEYNRKVTAETPDAKDLRP